MQSERVQRRRHSGSEWTIIKRDLVINRYVYLMLVPVVGYYLLFHYGPLYGAQIAFKDFSPARGILGSPWVGLPTSSSSSATSISGA